MASFLCNGLVEVEQHPRHRGPCGPFVRCYALGQWRLVSHRESGKVASAQPALRQTLFLFSKQGQQNVGLPRGSGARDTETESVVKPVLVGGPALLDGAQREGPGSFDKQRLVQCRQSLQRRVGASATHAR